MGNLNPKCFWPNCDCKTELNEPCKFDDPDFYMRQVREKAPRSVPITVAETKDAPAPKMTRQQLLDGYRDNARAFARLCTLAHPEGKIGTIREFQQIEAARQVLEAAYADPADNPREATKPEPARRNFLETLPVDRDDALTIISGFTRLAFGMRGDSLADLHQTDLDVLRGNVERAFTLLKNSKSISFNDLAAAFHNEMYHWWHDPDTGKKKDRNKGELLMLVVSEVSEAHDGERHNEMDDHLPHRRKAEVEIADIFLRLLDYCGAYNYDIDGAIREKRAYNLSRMDHKIETGHAKK